MRPGYFCGVFAGLFHLQKLPRLNSLVCHFPETLDLTFKLKRKSFLIEVRVEIPLALCIH